jgi:hypothetical protein
MEHLKRLMKRPSKYDTLRRLYRICWIETVISIVILTPVVLITIFRLHRTQSKKKLLPLIIVYFTLGWCVNLTLELVFDYFSLEYNSLGGVFNLDKYVFDFLFGVL